MQTQIGIQFEFEKAAPTGEFVRGWASVIEQEGAPVEDWDRDVISMDELRKAAHDYIVNARVGKAMHKGEQIAEVVESVIVDDEFAKTFGITDTRRGWWIGMRVNSEEIKKRVVAGELRMFSIGGSGKRTPLED